MNKNPEDVEDFEDMDTESEDEDVGKEKKKGEEDDEETESENASVGTDTSEIEEDDEIGSDVEEEIGIKAEKNNFMTLDNLDDDEDDDEDEDENYLQKFDEDTNSKLITDYHPELNVHNYDEVDALSRIVRDENGNIADPFHKTVPFITRYEKARILGERARQLNSGARAMVDIDPTVMDGYLIAMKEFEEKKIPFIIKRPLPNGGCEYWRFSDMEVLA
jgi:DNA-directed RNA polymerase I, II, and III subunit RPABC2